MIAVLQLQPVTVTAGKHTLTAVHLYPEPPALQVKMRSSQESPLFLTCTIHSLLGLVFAGLAAGYLIASVVWMLLLGPTLPAMVGAGGHAGTEGASSVQPLPMLPGCPTRLGPAQASLQSLHLGGHQRACMRLLNHTLLLILNNYDMRLL